jgi:hypothetical protein
MNAQEHTVQMGAVGVGGLVGLGHFMHMIEPFLADISYVAAIVVACITIYQKWKSSK